MPGGLRITDRYIVNPIQVRLFNPDETGLENVDLSQVDITGGNDILVAGYRHYQISVVHTLSGATTNGKVNLALDLRSPGGDELLHTTGKILQADIAITGEGFVVTFGEQEPFHSTAGVINVPAPAVQPWSAAYVIAINLRVSEAIDIGVAGTTSVWFTARI